MAGGDHASSDPPLHRDRQVHEPDGVAHLRPAPADPESELLVGHPEVIEQLLVGRGFLQRVEAGAVQVLQQRIAQHRVIRRVTHDRRDTG